MMDSAVFTEEMFKVDAAIRYIGVATNDYQVLSSVQRVGVPSLTSEETSRNFISIAPEIICEAVEKLSPFLGKVEGVTAHYEKALVVLYRIENLIVVISLQPGVETPFFNKLTAAFKEISARYLRA